MDNRITSFDDAERLWSKVTKGDECWVWTGTTDKDGYGILHMEVDDHVYNKAHRYAYFHATSEHPEQMLVCHTCDNPPCVRPDHLFLGTHLDNVRDMHEKGRANTVAGTDEWKERQAAGIREKGHWVVQHPEKVKRGDAWKLTRVSDANVAEIRRRWAVKESTQTAMAKEFGITFQYVSEICRNRARKVPPQ